MMTAPIHSPNDLVLLFHEPFGKISADFLAERIPFLTINPDQNGYSGALVRRSNPDHCLMAVGFANFSAVKGVYFDAEIFCAARPGVRWATRRVFQQMFVYPFLGLEMKRLTARVAGRNHAGRRLVEKVGFQKEGESPFAAPGGTDSLVIYGLLRDVAIEKWLEGMDEGSAREMGIGKGGLQATLDRSILPEGGQYQRVH